MPITFGELVQEVINEVRAKEQAFAHIQQQEVRIKALEGEVATLKKEKEEHKCVKLAVREPDNPNINPKPIPLVVAKEVK